MYFWHSNVVYHNEPGYACFIGTSWRWEVVACQVLLLWVLLFGSVGARETASEWMRVLFVFRRRYRHSLAVLRLLISANSLTCASIINATIYYFNQTWHCYSVTLNTHHDLCVLRCDLRLFPMSEMESVNSANMLSFHHRAAMTAGLHAMKYFLGVGICS